jgi:hypothetical protein
LAGAGWHVPQPVEAQLPQALPELPMMFSNVSMLMSPFDYQANCSPRASPKPPNSANASLDERENTHCRREPLRFSERLIAAKVKEGARAGNW